MSGRYNYTIPKYMADAFFTVYAYAADDEAYETFASHWGGLDLATFHRVAQQGKGDEKLIAFFALDGLNIPETTEILSSFLQSPQRLDRSICAVALAKRHDERAFPILRELLNDGIQLEEQIWAEENWGEEKADEIGWLLHCCNEAVKLLEQRNDPSLVPFFRKEFRQHWAIERAVGYPIRRQDYYDTLAYALGRYGDFTVLQDLDLLPAHRKVAMIYMALGALNHRISDIYSDLREPELRQQVTALLAEHFGLSIEEQQDCVENFYNYDQERSRYPVIQENKSNEDEDRDDNEDDDDEDNDEDNFLWVDPTFVCTYDGHTKRVHSLTWSPDSKYLASGSGDGTVQVWNATTGKRLHTFPHHVESVNAVSWSPQGNYVASGGNDNLVYVWDVTTGKPITIYGGHSAWINRGLAWSPDGSRIASASWDHTVQVWDAFTGKTLLTYHGHEGVVCSIAWSPDGKHIVSGGGFPECLIHIWNSETGALVRTYTGHIQDNERVIPPQLSQEGEDYARGPSSVHTLEWSPDGTLIASGGLRWLCRVWNASTGQDVLNINNIEEPIIWSSDGLSVMTSTESTNHVYQWSLAVQRPLLVYATNIAGIKAFTRSPDGKLLAASATFSEVKVWKAVPSFSLKASGEK